MTDHMQTPENGADRVLSILKPLLTSESSSSIRAVAEQLRSLNPPRDVLAATINTLAKLVSASPASSSEQNKTSQRNLCGLVSFITSSRLLSREILYSALDTDAASLLLDAENWRSDHLRTRTRMWYTQTRFNLFREETEGYAKALSHLWNSSLSLKEPSKVFETLISYIGQYSLDTNRVIEIILTATAERVLESITRTSGRPIVHRIPQPFAYILDQFPQNHVCAVIGAMLRTYHDSATADTEVGAEAHSLETDSKFEAKASHALVSLVSVMVSERKLQVADILGYLSPVENSEFTTRIVQYENDIKALAESVNGSRMGAHRTGDDLKTSSKSSRSFHMTTDRDVFLQYKLLEKGSLDSFYTHSQKINFILTLIGLCRSRDAATAIFGLSMNGEHIDVASCPTITKAFVGIIEALLSPLLHTKFPSLYAENKILTNAIRQLGGKEKGYDVPVETVEEFLSDDQDGPGAVIRQLLMILGPHARASIRLLQALCRIFRGRTDKYVISIMKEVVLPAASLIQSNVSLADDIWKVLRHWSHPTRWDLYGYVQRVVSVTNAEYQVVSSRASYETRYVLKRLTADNQKQHTLTIAKITHGQAIVSFSAALDRIQGYPADAVTISPVIEAFRRCTDLSIDILLYLVLNRMADSRRSRLKEDGINTAQWYATLSLFLGLCLRKLSIEAEHIDAVLYFLHSKLVEDDEPLMIVALSDIIKCVAGIEVDINLSVKQIRSYAGGPMLREVVNGPWRKIQPDAQLCGTASDFRAEKERNSATCMLLEAFERTKVLSYLAVSIARLTRDAVRHESIRTMPLKLGGNIVDMARTSLLQLSQFMDSRVSDSRRNKACRHRISTMLCDVGLGKMVQAMRVPVSSAISLVTPKLDCIEELEAQHLKMPRNGTHQAESGDNATRSVQNISRTLTGTVEDGKGPNVQNICAVDADDPNKGCNMKELRPRTHLTDFLFRRAQGSISRSLLTFFWYAKLSDISSPQDIYETEQKRFSSIKGVWEKEIETSRLHGQMDTDRFRRLSLELNRVQEYLEELETERKTLANRIVRVVDALKKRTAELVPSVKAASTSERRHATHLFLQECVLPRCKVSRPDALFCSRFVQLLLEQNIAAISFREYFETLLQLTPSIVRSCSENESLCFAYLIKETLLTLEGWRSNRTLFQDQVASTNGFRDNASDGKAGPMKHWHYCQWLYDIHESLVNGLSSVLSSGEYLYSRNSLSLLNAVAEVFPKVSEHCSKIELCVEKLTKSDLADVRLTSTGVLARLRAGKARRLPIYIFTLRPVLGGASSHRANTNVTGASTTPVRLEATGGGDAGPRPPSRVTKRGGTENGSERKETSAARVSPQARRSSIQPIGQEQAGSGKTSIGVQEKSKQAISTVDSSSNGVMGGSTPDGARKVAVRRVLNPNAREFVPVLETETISTQTGKRSRPSDGDRPSDSMRNPTSNAMDATTVQPSQDRPPPLKKARGEDKGKGSHRDGETLIDEKLKGNVPKDSEQAGHPVPTRESDKTKSITQSDEKDTITGSTGALQNGGGGRAVRDRANSPGRRNGGFRQAFENGKEYGHNKTGSGDRYRDNARLRNVRRDNIASNVSHSRDTVRDTAGRDHGPGRRREAFDHSGGGDRRAGTHVGDFRRSASESKLGEGSGGNDFAHGREYHGDAHGTKRRREGPSARGPYGYESEGRRQTRARKEGDYDRFHEDGKNGPDRRFSGNSPGRENGGTNNPNWMGPRRHGDVHENTRRQGDEDQIGWQKRGERDFEGGARGMRRDDRDMYYDRPERYGEGPGRREDRRRPPRGRPARRRTGRG